MENCSVNLHASARTLAKLGAFMAHKGSFQGKTLISEETWNELHSEPKLSDLPIMFGHGNFRTEFTKGGFCQYKKENMEGPEHFHSQGEKQFYTGRDGFYGW